MRGEPVANGAMVEALVRRRNPDRGYGARPGVPSGTETTAVALLGLTAAGETEASAGARGWLHDHELPGSGWPVLAGLPEASWTTALAVLALAPFPDESGPVQRGVAWLLGRQGAVIAKRWSVADWWFDRRPAVDLDGSLVGWPWVDGTFTWVEPTAYAMLALRAAAPSAADVMARIDEGRRVLLDRRCDDGGWNYGNSHVLGEQLWSYPDTTALALLALGPRVSDEVRTQGLDALDRMLAANTSGLATALGVLALAAGGRDVGALRGRLARRFAETGFFDDTRALGWAVLASGDTGWPADEVRGA